MKRGSWFEVLAIIGACAVLFVVLYALGFHG